MFARVPSFSLYPPKTTAAPAEDSGAEPSVWTGGGGHAASGAGGRGSSGSSISGVSWRAPGAALKLTSGFAVPFVGPYFQQLLLFPGMVPPPDDPTVPDDLDDTLPNGDVPGQLLLDLGL